MIQGKAGSLGVEVVGGEKEREIISRALELGFKTKFNQSHKEPWFHQSLWSFGVLHSPQQHPSGSASASSSML